MDRYVVAGNPVQHSQSPFIHARFAEQTGQALHYDRLLCPLDGFAETVRRFADEGGRGCNVTVPFKFEAFGLAGHHTERAALAGAANILRLDAAEGPSGWLADNADGCGLVRDIEQNAARPLAGLRVLVIGAGGGAAGALGPLLAARPAQLVLANRSVDKARALAARHAAVARDAAVELRASALADCGEAFDVVVNASASSLQGAAVPVSPRVLREGTLALDMMYGPAAEGFIAWAAQHGAVGRDGLGMLVEQAGEAFFVWRGVRPDTKPVLAELQARLAATRAGAAR